MIVAALCLCSCGGSETGFQNIQKTSVTVTIGGAISGLIGSSLVLQDNATNNLTLSAGATSFVFTTAIPMGGTYDVTILTQPSNPAENCSLTNGSGTAAANVTNIQVTCQPSTYTIGGSISGVSGTGLVLQDNGADSLSINPNQTSFTFATPVTSGGVYSVTVLTPPSSETCSVTNGSGTTVGNVNNIQITCSAVVGSTNEWTWQGETPGGSLEL